MSDVVISVENLSKHYRLGEIGGGTLQEDFERWWAGVRGRPDPLMKIGAHGAMSSGDLWALRDVSFEVRQGEVLGIIGRNGAGKSTLLKILSRTTAPTGGRVAMKGRMASLLEVGTGFHPELTGRENIFLNGAILGMTKVEIARKLDEIIDFSGVERFIDTPVKRYSSGMYVRLAFSVAAHLEPEILIVDEVLAVGDAEFQKKCMGKMKDVSSHGRTILFVSHNMGAVRQLCSKGIVLQGGNVRFSGSSNAAADHYLQSAFSTSDGCTGRMAYDPDESKAFQVLAVVVHNDEMDRPQIFDCEEPLNITFDCISREPVSGLYGYLSIMNKSGETVWESDSLDVPPNRLDALAPGLYRLRLVIPPRTLGHGDYIVYLSFGSSQSFTGFHVDIPGETVGFTVSDTGTVRGNNRGGYFSRLLEWQLESSDAVTLS